MGSEKEKDWDISELEPAVDKLASAVREGNPEAFETALEGVTSIREHSLFQEIGRLTRQLHEALRATETDSRVAEVARSEFPDARGRLDQVIAMTEKSAHRTMDLVEGAIPVLDGLLEESQDLSERWRRFRRKELDGHEFRRLVRDAGKHFDHFSKSGNELRNSLNHVLMAQDFQDLCGQEIRKVMSLVQDVENTLIDMIRAPDPGGNDGRSRELRRISDSSAADSKVGQDEADEILSSLGF